MSIEASDDDNDWSLRFSEFKTLTDNSLEVSQKELAAGLKKLGYDAPEELLSSVFDLIDEDATYRIGFGELKAWLMAG